ncbi:antitoxin HicB [Desulfohalotomaculum tongense]|uniref:type II toxin-antitoxin system HicB family antitoxin n=1 Tax=Desulforadius tongensis TaxID=1216062 RepID=UPI00195DB8F1|nr:type II toxin-antitoxin system HicB family antitoxin [Desulforadius tongensis]MBM7856119.1 antitoxin HicB [Desulforadius tongensis]
MKEKNLNYYLSLPYKIVLHPAEEGGCAAEIPELPGCLFQGETKEEALEMIEDAKITWLEAALESSREIAKPVSKGDKFSGKFVLRISKSLHHGMGTFSPSLSSGILSNTHLRLSLPGFL